MREGRSTGARALLAMSCAVALGACGDCGAARSSSSLSGVRAPPYPSCGEGELPAGEVIARVRLRASPQMRDRQLVERFELRRRDCLWVATARWDGSVAASDVEVVYDEELRPLRVWQRMVRRGAPQQVDIRRYELRTDPMFVTQRGQDGALERRALEGEPPIAVVGRARSLLAMWIRRTELDPGDKVRGPVLDVRGMRETLETDALRRDPERDVPWRKEPVGVYTVFGRDSVFTNDEGFVVGDLRGLRPAKIADTPRPELVERPGPMDTTGTP